MGMIAGLLDIEGATAMRADVAARMAGGAPSWCDDGARIALAGAEASPSADGRWQAMALGEASPLAVAELASRFGAEHALAGLDPTAAALLWDRVNRVLHLACGAASNHLLFWARTGGCLLVASDPAGLRAHPDFDPALDPAAAAEFLRLGHVPAPLCLFAHARKLAPGTVLTVRGGQISEHALPMRPPPAPFAGGPAAAAERLNTLLRAAVSRRLEAGAPPLVLLSGGPGSALLAGIARQLAGRVATLTLAPDGDGGTARAIAAALDSDHAELVPDGPRLPFLVGSVGKWPEPVASSHWLAAHLLAGSAPSPLAGDGAALLFPPSPTQPGWLSRLVARRDPPAEPRAAPRRPDAVRAPFLDPAIADFLRSLPAGTMAAPEVLHRYLPPGMCDDVDAPLPRGRWLAGPLADWAAGMLAPERLGHGLIDPRRAERARRRGDAAVLWPLLCLQAWIARVMA